MTDILDRPDTDTVQHAPARKNPAPRILAVVAGVLLAYYAIVAFSGVLDSSTTVTVTGEEPITGTDYLTVQMKLQDADVANRLISATVLPVPHGELVGDRVGEVASSLRIEINSGGQTTSVVTFPGESIVDPTSVTLAAQRGDTFYPFDQPFSDFRVSVRDDKTGEAVPFELSVENSLRPWLVNVDAGAVETLNGVDQHLYRLEASRDPLSVTLVIFYLIAILLTTLMAVVIVGSAILKKELAFSNVIWLSATMLSFPALRSAMPGAPPIGTALDFVVFFPCICIIAGMLVWTGLYLLWRESSLLRRRSLEDEQALAAEQGMGSSRA